MSTKFELHEIRYLLTADLKFTDKHDLLLDLTEILRNPPHNILVKDIEKQIRQEYGVSRNTLQQYRVFKNKPNATPEMFELLNQEKNTLGDVLRMTNKGILKVCDTCKKEKDGSEFDEGRKDCMKCKKAKSKKPRKEKHGKGVITRELFNGKSKAVARMDTPRKFSHLEEVKYEIGNLAWQIENHLGNIRGYMPNLCVMDSLEAAEELFKTTKTISTMVGELIILAKENINGEQEQEENQKEEEPGSTTTQEE